MKTRVISMAVCGASFAAFGCRSKLDVHSENGAQMPTSTAIGTATQPSTDTPPSTSTNTEPAPPVQTTKTPTPKDDSSDLQMASQRVYFQTRDTITLSIAEDLIKGAPSFTVLNTTNSGTNDAKAVTIVKEATPAFGLADDKSFSLDQVAGGKLQISFYPGQDAYQGKFFYGKNTIKVIANDNVEPRFAIINLTLQDFPIMDLAITSFATNVQVAVDTKDNYQFQGWVNVIAPPTVTAPDKTMLTTGLFNEVNPTN